MCEMKLNSYLFGANAIFVEELYKKYSEDPSSVDPDWRTFFDGFDGNDKEAILKATKGVAWKPNKPKIVGYTEPVSAKAGKDKSSKKPGVEQKTGAALDASAAKYTVGVMKLIDAYRAYGHIKVNYDPLGLQKVDTHAELDLKNYDITDADLDRVVNLGGELGFGEVTIREVIQKLEQIYCGRVGAEFFYLENFEERMWLQNRIEQTLPTLNLPKEDKLNVLQYLIEAETFEHFLHTKFPGTKRFSLEGGDGMIAALQFMIRESVKYGVEEVVLGMAHRGRLNTLTNVMDKPYHAMFSEFKGELAHPEEIGIPGDVKYHLGYSNDIAIDGRDIHISLTPNPSHLEAVNPVVLGKVRAKQDIIDDTERSKVVSVLIHGDAAFSGQGSVAESLYLSQLEGFYTGGTLHLIVNNQIGFTTDPKDARSTRYCSDLVKALDCPVFHVNGDDAESLVYVCKLAAEYRVKFKKDVFIDFVCYRKYGHNEGDEPLFTQPVMYKKIKEHEPPSAIYMKSLAAQDLCSAEEYENRKANFKATLEEEFELSKTYKPTKADWLEGNWCDMKRFDATKILDNTGYPATELKGLMEKLTTLPENFNANSKITRLLKARAESVNTEAGIDWGTGEALALASLLDEDYNIRITGQDVQRGTFSHRHAVLTDQETEKKYIPLNNLKANQKGKLEIFNSNLSEYGVLGFEYGCSFTDPSKLVIWEAQFGDFANTAQVIIDQYIASAEMKWLRMSGLVMLLPHGYEGQGPEHSSARLERFLQLCAMDNMQVLNCTTPASIYHALRRQLHREFRKPLIVMSPKSLLRHKMAVSSLEDFAEGTKFKPVIGEVDSNIDAKNVKKVVFCSGKVYYDLVEERANRKAYEVAIIRLEQLYPFASKCVEEELLKYKGAESIIWCQEEHKNMGAYTFIFPYIENSLKNSKHKAKEITYLGREESASPAVGYMSLHQHELQEIMNKLFTK